MCGGKFFPASLAFHQKACAKKQNFVLLPCPYCDVEVPKPELNTHIATACKKAPKNVQTSKEGVAGRRGSASIPSAESNAAAPQESGIFDEAGRMCCPVCNRWFNQDRIGKHQAICRKLEENNKRKKRPVFDSFQQRKFDPLIQRSDVEERHAKVSATGAVDPSALKAARSYYAGRQLHQTGEGHTSAVSMTESTTPASKKTKVPSGTAEKASEKTKPMTRPAGGTKNMRVDNVAGVTSRPTTAASKGDKRTTGASTTGERKTVANTSAAAGRRGVAASGKDAFQATNAQEKSKFSVQHQNRSSRLPPHVDELHRSRNPQTMRGAHAGGGGAILETNEASIENTLAYPNYPANWDAMRNVQENTLSTSAPARSAGAPRFQGTPKGVNVSGRGTNGGRGGNILETNETSADNPLAFPY